MSSSLRSLLLRQVSAADMLVLFFQRTCNRLRGEREEAMQAEQQALARATALEADRDKIQRQFKVCISMTTWEHLV